MRVVVKVMIIAHAIDVGPAMDLPIHGIVDTYGLQLANDRIIDLAP